MSPLKKRIAYKKKSGFPAGKYILYLIIFAAAVYVLFYHRFDNRTIYERVTGFFRSEIEKSPSVSIVDADREVKKVIRNEQKRENHSPDKEPVNKTDTEKDEIEEVIKKKLEGK